jgi:prephenate dehydrogenase
MIKPFEQVSIIGVGLLGGSLAKVMRELRLAKSIVGYGRNKTNLNEAKNLNIIDEAAQNIQSAVKNADLIIFCSPIQTIKELAMEISPHIKPGCLVTDVSSTKEIIVLEMEKLMPKDASFVGAHPIAGSEMSGFRVSTNTLYDGARCIITPTNKTDPSALKRIIELWETIGAKVSIMGAKDHDFIFGAISHLPHVLIFALMNTLGDLKSENHDKIISFAGAGLRDISRIAGSDPVMWRDICISNKDSILYCIDRFQEKLNHLRSDIEKEDGTLLTQHFEVANKHRLNLVNNL